MYEIELSAKAKKQLSKLDSKVKDKIGAHIERIKVRPHSFVKKLIGTPYFRLRVGDYRVILDIKNEKLVIMIIEVGHRRNIYN